MTEEGIKERIRIIADFDNSMTKLDEEYKYFTKACKHAIVTEKAPFKVYGLAYNFALTLRSIYTSMERYYDEIRNSLLYDRFETNSQYKETIVDINRKLIPYINNLEIRIDIKQLVESEKDYYQKLLQESQDLLSGEQMTSFSKDFAEQGYKIMPLLILYLNRIERLITDITTIRANLSDDDYAQLYRREQDDFFLSDTWIEYKDSFISRIVVHKYGGTTPEKKDLRDLYGETYDKIEDLHLELGHIESCLDDDTKLAKKLLNKNITSQKAAHVLELFQIIGKMNLISQWIEDLNNGELCYDPLVDKEEELADELQFQKLDEGKLQTVWSKILEKMNGRKIEEWVCFYHVLVFYTYINNVDFIVFYKWLNSYYQKQSGNKDELISYDYARRIKTSYWAENANKTWVYDNIPDKEEKARMKDKYLRYTALCTEIHNIIID